MADIEIVYRVGYCYCECSEYDRQCHTQYAEDIGCRKFSHPSHEDNVIPFGDCICAKFEYRYKGWTGKRYDIEEVEDIKIKIKILYQKMKEILEDREKIILELRFGLGRT